MVRFEGTLTALVTPFRDGQIDEKALRELVEEQVQGGIHGVVPCGTTGESVNLNDAEYEFVVRCVVNQVKGRIAVLAGAGTASTAHTIDLCRIAQRAGADGVLLVVPYYNRPTQLGLVEHYRTIARAVPFPAVLYNIPSRTGTDLGLEALELLSDVKDIVGIKEATGNVSRCQQILARFGNRFTVLSGDDALTLPMLSSGAHGVISVTANLVPVEVARVYSDWRDGNWDAARQQHLRLLPLHEAMFVETNPGPIKAALAMESKIAKEIRLPMVWPSEGSLERIRNAMTQEEKTRRR